MPESALSMGRIIVAGMRTENGMSAADERSGSGFGKAIEASGK